MSIVQTTYVLGMLVGSFKYLVCKQYWVTLWAPSLFFWTNVIATNWFETFFRNKHVLRMKQKSSDITSRLFCKIDLIRKFFYLTDWKRPTIKLSNTFKYFFRLILWRVFDTYYFIDSEWILLSTGRTAIFDSLWDDFAHCWRQFSLYFLALVGVWGFEFRERVAHWKQPYLGFCT